MFRVFTYRDLSTLRVYICDGKLWFVTADIVNLLGCEDTQKLSVEFVSYADKGITAEAPSNYIHIINECGAYSLICGVRNERSRAILHWLVDNVIPDLRKTAEPVVPAADVSAITAAPATEKYDFYAYHQYDKAVFRRTEIVPLQQRVQYAQQDRYRHDGEGVPQNTRHSEPQEHPTVP